MADKLMYPRRILERVSDRKKRKLAIDDSDGIPLESSTDSQINVVEDSQTSPKGYRDLFGELIPPDVVSRVEEPESKPSTPAKKTPASRKKRKETIDDILRMHTETPVSRRPTRVFIPTPRIMKIMKDAQADLYELMGLNKSSASDTSIVSNDSLNVSGVQTLLDSPARGAAAPPNEPETSSPSIDESIKESRPVLEGIVAFVDYKLDNDRSGIGLTQRLIEMGAQVEKTFNRKVTHVVFRDGYRRTYDKATERNIPLVSAGWIESSKLANKILDPKDYPPVDLEKYKKPREIVMKNFNLPKYNKYKKFLRQSDIDRDQLLVNRCDALMKRIQNFNLDSCDESPETNTAVKIPKKPSIFNKQKEFCKTDTVGLISDQLQEFLNDPNSPLMADDLDQMYLPMSVKILRKLLTPKEKENKTPIEINSELTKIEDRLNLNSGARQRLRKLLFPSNNELQNMSVVSEFPTPSPQKIRISAPARLTTVKKQKKVPVKKLLSDDKNLISNEKTPQDDVVKTKVTQWQIPSDLRPKIFRKIIVHKKNPGKTLTQETIPNMFSRNSTMIFETQKSSIASPTTLQTIACTGMKKCEVDIIKSSIQNLGTLSFHSKVEFSTTYLVTKPEPNRTLNMVFAMAYGCFIVSENWVHDSHKVGRWLPHQQYLISDLSEPVKKFQMRRHTFGSLLTFHIFDDAGNIYISQKCEPSAKCLKQLVRACGGKCTNSETMANIVVGLTSRMNNNISEKWILDCITEGSLLNKDDYILTYENSDII